MKVPRQIAIAEHLWSALGQMAEEMGSDREALVNQALHVFARLNGYVVPGRAPDASPAPGPDADGGRRAVEQRVLETAAALERAIHDPTPAAGMSDGDDEPLAPEAATQALYVVGESGELDKVVKERFVIGRGKHCDLVIDSAKVSREHAAIVRDGGSWFIEDLGSSNGTWHDRTRLERKRILDGDEFFISSEKIRCVLR